jgi:NADH:ubiquinone oxidoreductase subunit K
MGAFMETAVTVTAMTAAKANTKSAVKIGIGMTGMATRKPAIMILIRIGTIPATATAVIAMTMMAIVNAEWFHRPSSH